MQELPPGFRPVGAPPAADPVIAPADPYKQGSERRAEQDQALQVQAARREEERLRIAQQSEARQQEQQARENERKDQGFDATEGERKAAAFLMRALGANTSYEGTGVGARSLPGQMAKDVAPDLTNYFTSSERQAAESAQDEFIAASLRQDSGAAIPDQELERQRRIYFPVPGDSEQAIEQKRQARIRAIEGLKQSSGRLLDPTLQEWQRLGTEAIQTALDTGKSKEEILAIAARNGLSLDEEALDANIASRDQGGPTNAVLPPENEPTGDVQFDALMKSRQEFEGDPGLIDLAKSGITFGLSDEASGVGQAIGRALTGDFNIARNYQLGRDVERARLEQVRQENPVTGVLAELTGGGAGILPKAGAYFGAARQAAQGGNLTRSGVQSQLVRNATKEGAALGALGGFGYGEGAEGSATNALLGSVGGAVVGNLGQRAGNALANRGQGAGAQTQRAADDLGIQPIPAVTAETTTRRLTSGARQGFISDRPIARNVERMEDQGGAARDRIASEVGQVLDAEDAGGLVRQAANVYSQRTSNIGGKLYDRAATRSQGQTFPLPSAVAKADEWLGQLGKSVQGEGGTIYRDIKALRDQMADGEFELMSIPRTRDEFRAQIQSRGLRGTTADTAIKQILDEAEQDILSGLQKAGNEGAVGAFKTATDFWRKRVETIDEVLEPILGKNSPKSGEKIVTAIERMANPRTGDAAQLRRLMQALPEKEANSVRASVINRMGRPTAGSAQNADDAGFSFNTFLTSWNNMSPKAKATMFPKDARDALNKLATVSKGVKEAGSALNTSNTAGALVSQGALSGALWWAADPFTAIAAGGGQYAIGRLLASPKFARLLSGAPRQATPEARRAFAQRVGNLAKSEPVIARELGLYQRALVANDNAAGSVAAEEQQ